jgi:hypothetical protein
LRRRKVFIFEVPKNTMKKRFLGIGWKSKIMLKRATYSISINKLVAEGNCLEKGQELYCYLAEDKDSRKIMVAYLDGKKRKKA